MGCLRLTYYSSTELRILGKSKELTTKKSVLNAQSCKEARYYDCEVARFLSLDPMQIERLSLNPYNYVSGNPIMRLDPDGMLDTKFVDEEGNTIVETQDDSDQVFVIKKENEQAFINNLNENTNEKKWDLSNEMNEKLGKKYGYTLDNIYQGRGYGGLEGNSDFGMGYSCGYSDDSFGSCLGATVQELDDPKAAGFVQYGKRSGKSDKKEGLMNINDPKIKNNKAEYKVEKFTKEVIKMGDKVKVEYRKYVKN